MSSAGAVAVVGAITGLVVALTHLVLDLTGLMDRFRPPRGPR